MKSFDSVSKNSRKFVVRVWANPGLRRKIEIVSALVLLVNIVIFGSAIFYQTRSQPTSAANEKRSDNLSPNEKKRLRSYQKNIKDLGNGLIQADLYDHPVQYLDASDGVWKDIDTEIKTKNGNNKTSASKVSGKKNADVLVDENTLSASFSTNPAADLTMLTDGEQIVNAYIGANDNAGVITGNQILYPDAYQNTDIERTLLAGEVKQNIILKSSGHPMVFNEKLVTSLRVEIQSDNSIVYYSGSDAVATTPPIYITDADGAKVDVSLSYSNNVLTITLPRHLRRLTYPLIIDPTTTTVYPSSGDDGYITKTIDSYGAASYATNTTDTTNLASGVNSDCTAVSSSCTRAYLRFSLSGLGAISSATLNTYGATASSTGTLYHTVPFALGTDPAATDWGLATDSGQTLTTTLNALGSNSVTASVQNDYNNSRAYTYFAIYAGSAGTAVNTYAVDGASYKPYLSVTYTAVSQITTVGSSGTQISSLAAGSASNYLGGALTTSISSGTTNLSSFKISEKGTVNANANLTNAKLYYETAATCSYDGNEAQFGTTQGFDSGDTATFRGFATNGMYSYDSGQNLADVAKAVVADSANNIYVAGLTNTAATGNDWLIEKLNSAGVLDTTFGTSGQIIYNSGGTQSDTAYAIKLDSSGNVYVGGTIGINGNDWAIRKYSPAGVLDTTFGTSGMVTYNSSGSQSDTLAALALDSGSNVYAVGNSVNTVLGTGQDWTIRKYNSSGVLDTTFGASGMVSYNSGGAQADLATAIVLDASANLYVAGLQQTNGQDWAVRKYSSAGILDTTFGTSGMVTYDSGSSQVDYANAIARDSSGNIYVGGYQGSNSNDWAIRKYSASGVYDTTFGTVTYNSGSGLVDSLNSLVIDGNNNLYAGGSINGNANDWAIRKYSSVGVLDSTFGTSGMVTYNSGGSQGDVIWAMTLDSASNIYAVGTKGTSGTPDWGIRKYTSSGLLFDGSTISIGSSQMCFYIVVDVGAGATSGQTIELEVTNPSTDVMVSTGTTSPGTAVAIAGTTTIANNTPNPPTSLTAVAASTVQINLSWTAPSGGANHYHLYRGGVQIGGDIAATSYNDSSGLSANTQYSYTVRAASATNVESTDSNTATKYTLPNAPTGSSATTASASQINVAWFAGTGGANHYHIKSSIDAYASIKYDNTGTSWSNTGLTSNTAYAYRIYAVNGDNIESSTYAFPAAFTLADTPILAAPISPTTNNKPSVTNLTPSDSSLSNVTIRLYDNGTLKATTTANSPLGDFTFITSNYSSAFSDGNHTNITARSVNGGGVESPNSAAVTIYVGVATTVGATGTQVSTLNPGTTSNYVGGAFTASTNVGTTDLGSIKISEKGTVNANANLTNAKLYYETAASCSYDGTESQFGTAQGFDASDTATFRGFGTNGTVSYSNGSAASDVARASVKDSLGNIYVGGYTGINSYDWAIRKYSSAGVLDTTFGTSGMVTYDSTSGGDHLYAMVIDPFNNIYAVGDRATNGGDWAIRKYSSAGALDTTFGTNGMVTYNSGGTQADVAYAITIDSGSNIYVAGIQNSAANGNDWVIQKYSSNGVQDMTFGTVTYNSGGTQADVAYAITIDSSSNIYVTGYQNTAATGNDWVIRKYSSTGVYDTTFGTVLYNSGGTQADIANAITIDSSNNIYVAGSQGTNNTDWAIRKYSSSGVLDTSFGTSGLVTYNGSSSSGDVAYGIVLDGNGNFYVGGYSVTVSGGTDLAVQKYSTSGVLDTTFGTNGLVIYNGSGTLMDLTRALLIDNSGNLYAVGYNQPVTSGPFSWLVRKYTSKGIPFDGSAITVGTSQMCFYVVFDVGAGATNGQTIETEITAPQTDFLSAVGSVAPTSAVAIVGTTTIIIPDTAPPTMPQNLAFGVITSSSIGLSWAASNDFGGSGVAGYEVQRAPDSSGAPGAWTNVPSGTCSGLISVTSCVDSGLSPNTKYWYRVRGKDVAGNYSIYSYSGTNVLDNMEYSTDAAAQTAYVTSDTGPIVTGGAVTYWNGKTIRTFTGNDTLSVSGGTISGASVLVVGGGGGGGSGDYGGGGGGGQYLQYTNESLSGTIAVGIGSGGNGGNFSAGGTGGQTSFGSHIAYGGGGGGAGNDIGLSTVGGNGANGGGSNGWTKVGPGSGLYASTGQPNGYAGGSSNQAGGGGGGGAGGVGLNTPDQNQGGNGGPGLSSSLSGSTVRYAGGGGGGAGITIGVGVDGGGSGIIGSGVAGAGASNTGGGGGGGGGSNYSVGGTGGSGIVIVSYTTPIPVLQSFTEETRITQGSYALQGYAYATTSLNTTLTKTFSTPINLSNADLVNFDMRASRAGSNIKIGMHDTGGTTTEITPNIISVDSYQTVSWSLAAVSNANKDAIDQIIITITNADADNNFFIDNMYSPVFPSTTTLADTPTLATPVSPTNDNTPLITNNGTPDMSFANRQINLYDNGTKVGQTNANASGVFNFGNNPITNPSFEIDANADGMADNWNLWQNTLPAAPTYTMSADSSLGLVSQRVQLSSGTATNGQGHVLYQQSSNDSFAPGQTAIFTIYLKGTTTGASVRLQIDSRTNAGGYIASAQSGALTLTGSWQKFTLTYPNLPATTQAVTGIINVYNYNTGNAFDFYADNAKISNYSSVLADGNHANITATALNSDSVESANSSAKTVLVDTVNPVVGSVYDGTSGDQDWNDGSLNALSANWTGFSDATSGLQKYEYAVRRQSDGYYWNTSTNVWESTADWYNNALVTAKTVTPVYLQTSVAYYYSVRATDNAGNFVVASSNGQQVLPTFSFSISANTLNFSNLNNANGYTDSQNVTLTTSTNANGGYTVYAYMPNKLTCLAFPTHTISAYSSAWTAPTTWSGYGFGYTSSDATIAGSTGFSGGKYAKYETGMPWSVVADDTNTVNGQTGAITNEQFTITNKVAVPTTQTALKYTGTVYYISTANY